MKIVWNKYTWYSKLAAIIFFLLVLPILTFYIGTQYELTKLTLEEEADSEVQSITASPSHGTVIKGSTGPDYFPFQ